MKIINFLGNSASIIIIGTIVIFAICEKKNVFELFISGVKNGEKLIIEIFPTLIGLFVAVGMLSSSGIIEFVSEKIYIIFGKIIVFKEIIPLAILRPISGSTAMAIGTSIMQKVGVDSDVGRVTACIMGASETTIYVIAIYGTKLKNKNIKPAMIIGLIADFICIISCIWALKLGIIQ